MKLGTKVVAHTTRGNRRDGTLVKKHKGAKGEWWEIKTPDGNYKTRPSFVMVM